MHILLLSPYHAGSHRAWAEGYRRHSAHTVELLTLPGRFWKWRMHGGAVTLAQRFMRRKKPLPDLILATDMLDLTTFLALTRRRTARLPVALYMHENQLTYPLPQNGQSGPMRRQKGERDLHYAFINYASMLAADRILFNSDYHRRDFFAALPNFLKHFPEYNELETIEQLKEKSERLPVGVAFSRLDRREKNDNGARAGRSELAPLILWNQRWEYDKNPAAFFQALFALADGGVSFRLALCGERFGRRPPIFAEAHERLAHCIIHSGYAERERYRALLWEAEITVSTALHEFFGISILEAIYCHTFPILPDRLSYPEIIPGAYHDHCLYENEAGLLKRLRRALSDRQAAARTAQILATEVVRYDWTQLAPRYDGIFTKMVDNN